MRVGQQAVNQRGQGRAESGFTLVEVVCAVFVAAIAASVLFAGFSNGFALLRTTREDMRATQILMQKTEAFRLFTWQQLTNAQAQEPMFQEHYFPGGAATNSPGPIYCGTVSTTGPAINLSDNPPYKTSLHLITITLVWTNDTGSKPVVHSRQMQTLSALAGMQSYLDR